MINFVSSGNLVAGTTSLNVPFATGNNVNDTLVLCVANKYPNNGPTLPGGWSRILGAQATGGAGSAGIDSGTTISTIFLSLATGVSTGVLPLTLTSANMSQAQMLRYGVNDTSSWLYAATSGARNDGNTAAWITTGTSNPGMQSGDLCIVLSAINTDGVTFTLEGLTQNGVNFGTMIERNDHGDNSGQDGGIVIVEIPVVSGTGSTAAPRYAMTGNTSSASTPAGASVILRLREVIRPFVPKTIFF